MHLCFKKLRGRGQWLSLACMSTTVAHLTCISSKALQVSCWLCCEPVRSKVTSLSCCCALAMLENRKFFVLISHSGLPQGSSTRLVSCHHTASVPRTGFLPLLFKASLPFADVTLGLILGHEYLQNRFVKTGKQTIEDKSYTGKGRASINNTYWLLAFFLWYKVELTHVFSF